MTQQIIAAATTIQVGSVDIVLATAAAGGYTITLNHPTATDCLNFVTIKRTDTVAANTILVVTGSGLIDNLATWAMNQNGSAGASQTFYSDGTNFWVI